MAEISNKTLDEIRASYAHYECKWLFPVRMENNSKIEWVRHIYAALGKFKQPITKTVWDTCLRTGRIAAETPEEQALLESWWTEGYKYMPEIETMTRGRPCPILQMAAGVLGETLEIVYPGVGSFVAELQLTRHEREKLLHNIDVPRFADKRFKSAYPTCAHKLVRKEPYHWLLFNQENQLVRTFASKLEMAEYFGCGRRAIDTAVSTPNFVFSDGTWVWKVDWGFIPVSPKGEPVRNWEKDAIKKSE